MTFQARLQQVMQRGNLTVADLSRWFGRPYATINGWVYGTQLGGAPLDKRQVLDDLRKLEHLVRTRRGLPVPRMSKLHRLAHLQKLKRA